MKRSFALLFFYDGNQKNIKVNNMIANSQLTCKSYYILIIQHMNFQKFICLFVLICSLNSSDCNLDKFPRQVYRSQIMQSEFFIQDYVIDEYPLLNNDFTTPIVLYQTYTTIDTAKFVEGIPHPFYVKIILDKQKVKFQKWNLETQSLEDTSQEFQLAKPLECGFYSIDQQYINDALIHCENATHHRQYVINNLFGKYLQLTLLEEIQNIKTATEIVFMKNKVGYYSIYILMRKTKNQIIHLYQFGSSCTNCKGVEFIKDMGDRVLSQTGLSFIQYVDYFMLKTDKGFIEVLLIKDNGILLRFQSYYFDRWDIKNQTITDIVKIESEGGLAALTSSHLYFLSVHQNQRSEYRLVTKQLARISIQKISYSEVFSVGEYIVLADGLNWHVYYLQGENVKHFILPSSFKKGNIYVDNYHFIRNSFLIGNKHYLLQKPSLILGNSSKQVILRSSKCNRTIAVKILSNNKVEVINEKTDLVWNNGKFENLNQFCEGNNVSSSLFIKSKNYNISKVNYFNINLPSNTQVINFVLITSQLLIVLTKKQEIIQLISCFKGEDCQIVLSYNEKIQGMKFMEARLDLINAQYQQSRTQEQQLSKELLLTMVWDVRYYYTIYYVYANKLKIRGGWESPSWKFIDFQLIGYSPQKRSYCSRASTTIHFVAYSQNRLATNNWAHSYFQISTGGGSGGAGFSQRSDIMFGYMEMCSISNFGMTFLLYKFEGGKLSIKSIEDRDNFYIQKGFASFDNIKSNKAICTSQGLAVFNSTQIIVISQDLKIIKTVTLTESLQNDKISGKFLLHSNKNSIVQVYDLDTGFLITSLNQKIDDIIAVKQSDYVIGLKNGTFVRFRSTLPVQVVPDAYALLTCFNGLSSTNKLISIKVINDLHLPQPNQIDSWSIINTNLWNATVSKLQGVTPLSKLQNITFFTLGPKGANRLTYSDDQTIVYRYIYGQQLQIWMNNYYCMRQTQDTIYYSSLMIFYGNQHSEYFSWSNYVEFRDDIFAGVTNFYQNRISIVGYNQSSVNFMTLQFDKNNLSNVQIFNHSCGVNVWVQDDFQINRRLFKSADKIYMLRFEIGLWNSTFIFSNDWIKQYDDYPRRIKAKTPKIQIFTLSKESSQCYLQQITHKSFGYNEQIKDFMVYEKQNKTYLFILTTNQIIIMNDSNRANNISVSLNKQFSKIDVRNDLLLLISQTEESQVYHILWQQFPYAGTLELEHTLARVDKDFVGGVIMEKGFILATAQSLILYLRQNKKYLYSIQKLKISDRKFFRQTNKNIENISYKSENAINVECQSYNNRFETIQVGVSFSADGSNFDKLIVSNEKETKQYLKKSKGNEEIKQKQLSYD